jgi:hypothetical protein
MYAGFSPENSKLIIEALNFVLDNINANFLRQKQVANPLHHSVIEKAYEKEVDRISRVTKFVQLEASDYGLHALPEDMNSQVMSIIRSALEVYLKDTVKVRNETGAPPFDSKIQAIKEIIDLEGPKKAKADVYDKYYQVPASQETAQKIEIFISYSNKDKIIAGKIAQLLTVKGIAVFLAHEDIEVSDEWRSEILDHLINDNYMVSLLTNNYAESTWENQEAGYIMGKGGKNISLIMNGTDIKKFAFLESLQGINANTDNIEACVDKILDLILR